MYGEMSDEALVANARQEERNHQAVLQARAKSAANVTAFFADGELATVVRIEEIDGRCAGIWP